MCDVEVDDRIGRSDDDDSDKENYVSLLDSDNGTKLSLYIFIVLKIYQPLHGMDV